METLVNCKTRQQYPDSELMISKRGCTTPNVVKNVEEKIEGNLDYLDGYDDLPEREQGKVRLALDQGHIADEDWTGVSLIPLSLFQGLRGC